MVNTERVTYSGCARINYNILNIVVNTEHIGGTRKSFIDYNILNIVVNTEPNDILIY